MDGSDPKQEPPYALLVHFERYDGLVYQDVEWHKIVWKRGQSFPNLISQLMLTSRSSVPVLHRSCFQCFKHSPIHPLLLINWLITRQILINHITSISATFHRTLDVEIVYEPHEAKDVMSERGVAPIGPKGSPYPKLFSISPVTITVLALHMLQSTMETTLRPMSSAQRTRQRRHSCKSGLGELSILEHEHEIRQESVFFISAYITLTTNYLEEKMDKYTHYYTDCHRQRGTLPGTSRFDQTTKPAIPDTRIHSRASTAAAVKKFLKELNSLGVTSYDSHP
jgi:hypothetical protein